MRGEEPLAGLMGPSTDIELKPFDTPFEPRVFGAAPWLATLTANAPRMGPSAWPFPGIASVAQPLNFGVFVDLVRVESIMEAGLVLKDLSKFADTDAGVDFLQASSTLVYAPKGAVLFAPWGFSPTVLYDNPNATKDDSDWAHVWVYPYFAAQAAEHVVLPQCAPPCLAHGLRGLAHGAAAP